MNKLLFDYLSVTSKIHSIGSMIDLLGMSDVTWEEFDKGAHGYSRRKYFNGVNIFFQPSEDNEYKVWLEMAGAGCRTFETYGHGDWDKLFDYIRSAGDQMHLTRIDVAYDDMPYEREEFEAMTSEERVHRESGILDIKLIKERVDREDEDAPSPWYVSVARSWMVERGSSGTCIYIGSAASDVRVRIYDKAKERKLAKDFHWVRVELVLRNNNAIGFVNALADHELGECFGGVLITYLRFVEPDPNDTNRSRWRVSPWWQRLIQDAERIRIALKPGVEYNLLAHTKYVCGNMGNAVYTAIECLGLDCFLNTLQELRPKVMNTKYQALLAENKLHGADYDLDFWLEYRYKRARRFDEVDKAVMDALKDYQYRKIVEEKLQEQGKFSADLW